MFKMFDNAPEIKIGSKYRLANSGIYIVDDLLYSYLENKWIVKLHYIDSTEDLYYSACGFLEDFKEM